MIKRQLKHYIPFFSAPVSFLSSLYLVYSILKLGNQKWLKKPKEQLLLGLSVLDICGSFAHSFNTLAAPHWINAKSPTKGNERTCAAQGFLVQLSLGAPMYNACICLYYLLSVRYRVDQKIIQKNVLPLMHLLVFAFAFGTALTALLLDWYHYAGLLGCWINTEKEQWACYCEYGDGQKSGLTYVFQDKVNNEKKQWGCYGEPSCNFDWEDDCGFAKNPHAEDCISCKVCPESYKPHAYQMYFGKVPVLLCFFFVVGSMMVLYHTVRQTELRSRRWTFGESQRNFSTNSFRGGGESSSRHNFKATSSVRCTGSSQLQHGASNKTGSRLASMSQRTMETGLLYSGALLLTYFPSGLDQFISKKGNFHSILQLLVVFFLPLQGFFNMLIYKSPEWLPVVKGWKICNCFTKFQGCCRRQEPEDNDRGVKKSPISKNIKEESEVQTSSGGTNLEEDHFKGDSEYEASSGDTNLEFDLIGKDGDCESGNQDRRDTDPDGHLIIDAEMGFGRLPPLSSMKESEWDQGNDSSDSSVSNEGEADTAGEFHSLEPVQNEPEGGTVSGISTFSACDSITFHA